MNCVLCSIVQHVEAACCNLAADNCTEVMTIVYEWGMPEIIHYQTRFNPLGASGFFLLVSYDTVDTVGLVNCIEQESHVIIFK